MTDKSNIKYNSNIEPAGQILSEDVIFLSKVRDYFALKKLSERTGGRYKFTKIQEEELLRGMKCAYSPKGEYCWGIKRDNRGKERITCTCLQTGCKIFRECRPDFDEKELYVLRENQAETERINNALSETVVILNTGFDKKDLNVQTGKDTVAGIIEYKSVQINDVNKEAGDAVSNRHVEADVKEVDPATNSSTSYDRTESQNDVSVSDVPRTVDAASRHRETDDSSVKEDGHVNPDPIKGFGSFESSDQDTIIRLVPEERTIVNAGPGTGKTYTLIEKIIYMINDLDVEPERILILCFSRAAVEVIKERMEQAVADDRVGHIWQRIDIRTFDSYITYMIALIADVNPALLPTGYKLENQSYEERILTGINLITENPNLLDYDHIIVDEVQDLVGSRARLVLTILQAIPQECGFTILGDACQALYDYLSESDSGQMSSAEFYNEVFSKYRNAHYLALEKNFRQGDEYEKFTRPYRTAILSGDALSRTDAAKVLAAGISDSGINMKNMTEAEARKLIASGSLGILTRNNGQALQISTWLRNNDIPHRLQHSLTRRLYGAWIAAVFMDYDHAEINETEFEKAFNNIYPDTDAYPFWDALVSTQRNQNRPWYDVEDILKGILYSPKDPLLFENAEVMAASITVSNIHRAKGREFDSVLVLDDVLQQMQDPEKDDINEHKVCYVAVTRPRKRINKFKLSGRNNFFYSLANDEGRCFKSNKRPGKKVGYLSHIEIGKSRDLLEVSFAASAERQNFIRNNIRPDMGILLKKMPENEIMYGNMSYSIHLDDNPAFTLGYMGQGLRWGIANAWQRIFNNKSSIAYSYFPEILTDVHVERLTSCISVNNGECPGAKVFGSMCIWTGLSLTGLAHRANNTLG